MVIIGHGGRRRAEHWLVDSLRNIVDPYRSDPQRVLQHVSAPVVFVSLRDDWQHTHRSAGQVVVGVDMVTDPEPALRFAFEAASHRAASLVLLRPFSGDREADVARRILFAQRMNDALATCKNTFPSVRVSEEYVTTRLPDALAEHAPAAALVVLGTAQRGWLRRHLPVRVERPGLSRLSGALAIVRT